MAWINDTGLPRIVVLQKNAIDGSEAFPDPRKYLTHPYWSNNAALTAVQTISRFERRYVYQVTMALHTGKMTEGYDGTISAATYGYMESVTDYFEDRPFLQINVHDSGLDYIDPGGCSILRATAGLVGSQTDPDLGVAYILEVPLNRLLNE